VGHKIQPLHRDLQWSIVLYSRSKSMYNIWKVKSRCLELQEFMKWWRQTEYISITERYKGNITKTMIKTPSREIGRLEVLTTVNIKTAVFWFVFVLGRCQYLTLHVKKYDDWWTMKMKGFGGKGWWANRATVSEFPWRYWGLSWKFSVRIFVILTKNRGDNLQNTSVEFYRCINPIGDVF
jgi:hypothetical protein